MNRERGHEINMFANLIISMCDDFKVAISAEGGKLTIIDGITGKRYGILNDSPELGGER